MIKENIEVPSGKIAAVSTYLEMFERPAARLEQANPSWIVRRAESPQPDWYRRLFRRVGEEYLWFSRLTMTDDELRAILHHPLVEVYASEADGASMGFFELNFRERETCELSFLGVEAGRIGQGLGRYLMNRVLEIVWSRSIRRFWVHTCTLDHANAVPFYLRSGFRVFRRQIEIIDDPRITGVLARTAAPQVPLL